MDNSINGREIKEVVLDDTDHFGTNKTNSVLRFADETEQLFAQAVEYRAKLNESKTSVAKNLYAKKLKKIVAKKVYSIHFWEYVKNDALKKWKINFKCLFLLFSIYLIDHDNSH